jgi:hypothetical protein
MKDFVNDFFPFLARHRKTWRNSASNPRLKRLELKHQAAPSKGMIMPTRDTWHFLFN